MELTWDLTPLYESFESEKFQNDVVKLDELIEEVDTWSQENFHSFDNAPDKLETFLKQMMHLHLTIARLLHFTDLTFSTDAKNSVALKWSDRLQSKLTQLTRPDTLFRQWLKDLEGLDTIVESTPFLAQYRFYLQEQKTNAHYLLPEAQEIIIAKLEQTGSSAWQKLFNVLNSMQMVEYKDKGTSKQLPLAQVRNLAYSGDPTVREQAYHAELRSYTQVEESLAAALNAIKGEVLTMCELRGYKSPLEQTLLHSRMDRETLDAMLNAIRAYLPEFHRYFKGKAAALNHKGGLPFYDLFAPLGSSERTFTYAEACDYIEKQFGSFSDELASFARNAFEKRWIDVEPREGKRGGAFCANLQEIKESRVLTNFTGSFSDMTTLAHELGHAYHGYCLKDEALFNTHYPMPLAETASIFCETIVIQAALQEVSEQEKITILESQISDAGQVLVDIYSRYLFETNVFESRDDGSLSVNELNNMMLEAQKQAYGDGLDPDNLHPYMWACKPHYYSSGLSFYNFPYAFGLLFAKGLYAKYQKDTEAFVGRYPKLLAQTGKGSVHDVAATMDIDIRQQNFWEQSLNLIKNDIDRLLNLL